MGRLTETRTDGDCIRGICKHANTEQCDEQIKCDGSFGCFYWGEILTKLMTYEEFCPLKIDRTISLQDEIDHLRCELERVNSSLFDL